MQISLGSFLQHVPKGEKPPKMNAPEEPVTIRGINRVGTGVESSDKPCNMTIARFHHTEPVQAQTMTLQPGQQKGDKVQTVDTTKRVVVTFWDGPDNAPNILFNFILPESRFKGAIDQLFGETVENMVKEVLGNMGQKKG